MSLRLTGFFRRLRGRCAGLKTHRNYPPLLIAPHVIPRLDSVRRFCTSSRMLKPVLLAIVCSASAASLPAADRSVHSFERVTLTTEFWSEGAGYGDFNRDGKLDVASGPYCGTRDRIF